MIISSTEIEEAVAFIRQATIRQIEAVETFTNAASLAADQVQDKRLEILELGPEVTGIDVFWDFALTFILESPSIGRLLHRVSHYMLLPRVRSRMAAQQVALMKAIRSTRIQLIPHRLDIAQLISEVRRSRFYANALNALGSTPESGVFPYVAPFLKAIRQKEEVFTPTLEPSDTPGVAIQDLAQAYASTQRIAIQTEHSILELGLRTARVPPKYIYDSLEWNPLVFDNKEISLSIVRDYAKRYFELLIWTLLLLERPFTGTYVTTPRQSFTLKGYVQPSLIQYWLKRFIDPRTGKPFSETPALRRPDGKPDLDRSIPALGNYMWKIAEQAIKNKVALVSSGFLIPKGNLLQ